MNTKLISQKALDVIAQYENFSFGNASCGIPYFNNKTSLIRAGLRANIGKGSPKDIYDELQAFIIKYHIDPASLDSDNIKKILVENNIGIDCSAFAYYVLNAFSIDSNYGQLDRHLKFTHCSGILGKMRCKLRPVENCDVMTMSDNANSHIVRLDAINVGDFISMTNSALDNIRDHILIIYKVEYQNFKSIKLYYSHAIAYPDDGVYGTGIKKGEITITSSDGLISDQEWMENNKTGEYNVLLQRAKISTTEVRRMNWFK